MEIEETETENLARQIWYVQLWSGTTCPLPSPEATAKAVALIEARDAATEAKVREEYAETLKQIYFVLTTRTDDAYVSQIAVALDLINASLGKVSQ
jgi:hypothetical protein